jgi:hypothetical protein
MSMRRMMYVMAALAASFAFAAQVSSEPTPAESFGFPASSPGTVDIRIWLGGGIVVPTTVYRLYDNADGIVRGQVILWLRLHDEGAYAGKPTNRDLKRLMRKNCGDPRAAGKFIWCEHDVDDPTLRVTMSDLQLETLASLSDSVVRDCGWLREDGETVTIELLRGSETHRLSISNPDFCCSEPVCAFVNNARDVVERNMQVQWGQSNSYKAPGCQ